MVHTEIIECEISCCSAYGTSPALRYIHLIVLFRGNPKVLPKVGPAYLFGGLFAFSLICFVVGPTALPTPGVLTECVQATYLLAATTFPANVHVAEGRELAGTTHITPLPIKASCLRQMSSLRDAPHGAA